MTNQFYAHNGAHVMSMPTKLAGPVVHVLSLADAEATVDAALFANHCVSLAIDLLESAAQEVPEAALALRALDPYVEAQHMLMAHEAGL